jgi:hypothetical protein
VIRILGWVLDRDGGIIADVALERMSLAAAPGLERCPTPEQKRALRVLGVANASVRHAAHGADVFAYVEDESSTLRLQIAPDGGVVGQTVLARGQLRTQAQLAR